MRGHDDFDQALAHWLDAESVTPAPSDSLERVVAATRHRTPRPAWLAGLGSHWVGGGVVAGPSPRGRSLSGSGLRWSTAMLLLLLIAALLGGAIAIGAGLLRSSPRPIGGISHLAYGLDGDIYLADADGQNSVRIADGGDGQCSGFGGEGPMWSPDGRYLAYRSAWNDTCSGSVHLSDANGQPVASFPGAGWLISWSPDSTRVATWLDLFHTVGIYGVDGTRQALLTAPRGCAGSGDHDPLWSPDGQSVVAAGCEMPIDGRPPRVVLGRRDPHVAADSPDGTRVAYVTSSDDGRSRRTSLVVADVVGTELQVLTSQTDYQDPAGEIVYFSNIIWSPSGDRVAFTRSTDTIAGSPVAAELRVLDVSSGAQTTIATDKSISALSFSPDGDRILFTTRDDNEVEGLWAVDADGSDKRALVPGSGWGDWQPLAPGS
jgi:Tol biopolymer transport system component